MVAVTLAIFALLHQAGPTATVEKFLEDINAHDFVSAAKLVKGGKPFPIPESEFKDLPTFKLEGAAEKVDGDNATVTGTTTIDERKGKPPDKMPEVATLVRESGAWLIVGQQARGGQDVVEIFAYLMAHPEMMQKARAGAKTTVCLSNAKQLALGVLMYTNDNNDKFPKKADGVHTDIYPYTKNRKLWFCPNHPDMVAFTFNAKLLGRTTTSVAKPAETVMIYQGKQGKLEYEADGQCVVAFTDGHVALVTKERAAKLTWKP